MFEIILIEQHLLNMDDDPKHTLNVSVEFSLFQSLMCISVLSEDA